MTLRAKLLLAQAPLALAAAVIAVFAIRNISTLGHHSEMILKDNYRSVLAAQRMAEAVERLQDVLTSALLDPESRDTPERVAAIRKRFERELAIQEGNITEPSEGDITRDLRQAWTLYQDEVGAILTTPDSTATRLAFRSRVEPAAAKVRGTAEHILAINQDAMLRKSDLAVRAAEHTSTLSILVFLIAFAGGLIVSMTLLRRLLAPLEMLTDTVHRIGKGDFSLRIDVSGRDEVAQLAESINSMAIHLDEYRRSSLGELLLAQQAAQATIDSLPDPVIVFDLHGAVLDVNQAGESVLGLGNKPLAELDREVLASIERARTHVAAGKGPYHPRGFEESITIAGIDGDRHFLTRATPVADESGGITGVTVVLQDVTRARLIDELGNDLVATVAHELRTPLTSLLMAVHMCLEHAAGPLTDKQADLLYTAREDCQRMQSMVDALLDLARIRSGRIELKREPVSPETLIQSAIEGHQKSAEEKDIAIETEVATELAELVVDRQRIQLVLSNLLTNALRHTPRGGSVTLRVQKGSGDRVRFDVADTGEGIPEDYRDLIFDKFVRVPGRSSGGAGLGLSICRDIIQAHGGNIGADETPGGGATVWFEIPVGERSEAASRSVEGETV